MVGNVQALQRPEPGPEHVAPVRLVWQEDAPGLRGMPPQGLRNLGNTCYLNSVLQCLTYTPPLANYCLLSSHTSLCEVVNCANSGSCAFCFLERRINRSLTSEAAVDAPLKISHRLRIFAAHFRGGRQEDAHEFLRYAIEACNNSCIQLLKATTQGVKGAGKRDGSAGKEEPHTVIKEIFGGVLQSQVKCLSCEGESNKRDEIMDLSLDIGRPSSLKEALCSFFQPEVLDADNKYRCGNCKRLSTARKQMSIFRAPNVLVIQFKRFENFFGGKIDRHIQFEERLGLTGHMCKASKDARPDYSLYGVIIHAGHTQSSGHYYAYVKDSGGRWYCCNDASVSPVSIQSVLADKAYILFYVRTNGAVKKVPRASCGPVKPSFQASDGDGAHSQKQLQQDISLPSVKANGCANSDNNSTVSSVTKTQLHFYGPRKADVDRLKPVKVDNCPGREHSDKVVLPRTPDNQLLKEILLPEGRLTNGHSESALVESLTVERDTFDSTITSGTVSQPSHSLPEGGDVSTSAASLLDLAAAATSPSMNTSSSSSNQFIVTADPASGCTGASSGENRVPLDSGLNEGCSVQGVASVEAALVKFLKRSRLENVTQSQGSDSGTSVSVSTLTNLQNAIKDDDARGTATLDVLKCRLENEGREKLRHSDWCDALRKSLRAAKRRRLADQACSSDGDKLLFRKQIVEDVHEAMIGTVPNSLKENMVENLQNYFRRQSR